MVLMNWNHAILITSKNDYSISLSYDIIHHGLNHNITFRQHFIDDNECMNINKNDYGGLIDDIKESNYNIIILIASEFCPPDSFKDISKDNYVWILSESVGDIIQKDKDNYQWLIRKSLIPRFPKVKDDKMDELNEFYDILKDHDECSHIFYDIYDSIYSPFYIDTVNAFINSYNNCINENDVIDCNNPSLINEYVKTLKFNGLEKDYDLSKEVSFPSYEIYRYINNDSHILSIYDESIEESNCNTLYICKEYYNDNNDECYKYIKTFYYDNGCSYLNISSYPNYITPNDGVSYYIITLNHPLSVVSFIVSFLLLSLLTITFSIVLKNGEHEVIERSSKMFLLIVLISLMILSISFNFYNVKPTDLICNLRFWISFIGYILLLSTFIIRIRSLLKKYPFILSKYIIKLYLMIISPMIILLILWSSIPNQRPYVDEESKCSSKSEIVFYLSNLYILLVLIIYIALSFRKNINDSENESLRIIFYIISSNIIIGFILDRLIKSILAFSIIEICLISINILVVWIILFIPKIYNVLLYK